MNLNEDTIRKLRAGDHETWRKFFVAYHAVFERALRAGRRRLGGAAPAARADDDDVLAEAMAHFCEVFTRGFHTLRTEGQFRAYLFHTVHHFLLQQRDQYLRARRRGGKATPPEEVAEALEDEAVRDWREHRDLAAARDLGFLEECLARLHGSYLDVITLYHFADAPTTLKTIARQLGESYESVRKRYQRALAKLQACVVHKRSAAEERRG